MARDPKQKRKIYEGMIGKDLADKLSDAQIDLLSKYYNSLDDKESSNLYSRIMMGYNDTPLHDMARDMAGEEEDEEEPEGLDDILGDIRAEKVVEDTQENLDENLKSTSDSIMDDIDRIINEYQEKVRQGKEVGRGTSGALATIPRRSNYQEKGTDKEVEENIDPKILELLGLEDTTDFTYDEYKTLLREKMVAGRMVDSEMSSEDTELLTDEFKRVRSNTGEFVIKSDRGINFGSSVKEGSGVYNRPPESETKEEKASVISSLPASLDSISSALVSIADIIKVDVAVEEKENDIEEKNELEKERKAEEAQNEIKKDKKGFKFPEVKLPQFDFLDMIKTYIGNVIAGSALLGALKWLQDPKNQEKIDGFVNFITENAPLILGGILSILGFNIVKKIAKLTFSILGAAVKLTVALGKLLLIPGLALGLGLAAGAVAATAALKGPMEQGMENTRRDMYGEENLDKGTFITKLRDQYGRIASEGDRDRLLSDDDKLTAELLKNYDNQLKKVKKLQDEIEQLKLTRSQAIDPRRKNQLTEEIKKKEKGLESSKETVLQMEQSINIDGKSFTEMKTDFEQNLILPQTDLSKELYPKSGTGEDLSVGLPRSKMMTERLFNEKLKAQEESGEKDKTLLGKDNYEDYIGEFVPGSSAPSVDSVEPVVPDDVKKQIEEQEQKDAELETSTTKTTPVSPAQVTEKTEDGKPLSTPMGSEVVFTQDRPTEAKVDKKVMPKVTPPGKPRPGRTTVLPVSPPKKNKGGGASANGGNKEAPYFDAVDPNNQTTPVVRSILNLNN